MFAYARNAPQRFVDPTGRNTAVFGAEVGGTLCGPVCAGLGAALGAGYIIYQCFKEKPEEEEEDEDRSAAILRGCKNGCVKIYSEDQERLPGRGKNYSSRLRQCIRQCAKSYGCSY